MHTGHRDSYQSTVEAWTAKEMQLNRLHEEIVAKRESLLRSSGCYSLQQSKRGLSPLLCTTLPPSAADATRRNNELLQDIEQCELLLEKKANAPPSGRFSTLQCNYTSMVNGMFPLWERTACLDSVGSGSHRQQAETDGTAVSTGVTFASPISSRNHPRKTT